MSLIGIAVVIPFLWMISTSLKPSREIVARVIRFLPLEVTFEHYQRIFTRIPFFLNLLNSVFVSGLTTAIAIFFSTMVGYAIAKFNSTGLRIVLVLVLTALMIPPFLIAIPLYIASAKMGLVNNLLAVVIPFAVSNFGIFLMRQFCLTIPDDLLDASRIDGASEFRIFVSVALPLVASGAAAFGILKFLMTWNDFFWPLLMLSNDQRMTLQVVLGTSIDFEMGVRYGYVMALTTLTVLPVLVLYVVFQRRIIQGIALSGLKG
jgi:multiple sugar transport system permease protein